MLSADRTLGRLARWLRLCGLDVTFDPAIGGADLLHQARREGRIALTRDKRLRTAKDVVFVESGLVREQLAQVLTQLHLDPSAAALTRCPRCNSVLQSVQRETVMTRVPPFVYASHEVLSECAGCGHLYWPATHCRRILAELAALSHA